STKAPDLAYETAIPHAQTSDPEVMLDLMDQFRPHVMHGHWLLTAPILLELAEKTGIPFTVRSHSFDVLGEERRSRFVRWLRGPSRPHVRAAVEALNAPACLGVIGFPYTRPLFVEAGVRDDKVRDCWPVVNYDLFHDRSPNGDGVMNTGAA